MSGELPETGEVESSGTPASKMLGAKSSRRRHVPRELGIVGVWIAIVVIFSLISSNFLTLSDLLDTFLNSATIVLLAMGEAFVLLIGEIDLSVGAVLALSGVGMAEVFERGLTAPGAIIVAILLGGAIGLFNGILVAFTRIPSFIVTFAALGIASSIPLILTKAVPIYISASSFSWIGQTKIGPVPLPLFFVVGVALVFTTVLSRTLFGSRVYAVGGNREAARLSGLPIKKVVVLVFVLSGLAAGLAGAIEAGRLGAGYPTAGSTTELFDAIAGAVVGGVSLFGGIGTVPGALVGAVIVGTLEQGLDVLNVSTYWQPLVIGLVILVGVGADSLSRRERGGHGVFHLAISRLSSSAGTMGVVGVRRLPGVGDRRSKVDGAGPTGESSVGSGAGDGKVVVVAGGRSAGIQPDREEERS